jgi:hypothetical protein
MAHTYHKSVRCSRIKCCAKKQQKAKNGNVGRGNKEVDDIKNNLRTFLAAEAVGKLCTRVYSFIPEYEFWYLVMKFSTWLWNLVPGYEI